MRQDQRERWSAYVRNWGTKPFVGLNDSFEQVYQAIRRFWRFGQTKPVNVHFIAARMDASANASRTF